MGPTFAQPLVAPQISINGKPTDLLLVATGLNIVYAFDAVSGAKIWETTLGTPIVLPNSQIGPSNYRDMEWQVGILSTPVADTAIGAVWAVSTSVSDNVVSHHLYKLDLATGKELKPPVAIEASSGNAKFVSHRQLQRSALLLSNGKIYIAFASYGDQTPYHGWVLSYDAASLAQTDVFCVTPQGSEAEGGIWQAGEGPCADDQGNLYVITGNGAFDPGKGDYGDCVVRLDQNLKPDKYFSPWNNKYLDANDLDLGSGGLLAIPGESLVVGGGKEAILYLMKMDDLGGFNPNGDKCWQKVNASTTDGHHHIHGTPVFWNGTNSGSPERRIYVWTENDQMKAFRLDATPTGSLLTTAPVAQTTVTDPNNVPGGTQGMPGGFMTISANGPANGIVWALHPWNEDLNQKIGQGVLRAFDATSLAQLYSSKENVGRDDFGNLAKFCPPTVYNGRAYIASMGGIERKVTLPQPLIGTPALVSRGRDLLVAWSGSGHHLNLMRSTDGMTWSDPYKIPSETTDNSLALAYNSASDKLYIAWRGTDSSLNVMSATAGKYDEWSSKKTLERSDHGPALVCGNGRLAMAWTGTDCSINLYFSNDGSTWEKKKTLSETCPTEPSLAFYNNKFYLLWNCNSSDRQINVMTFDGDGNIVDKKKTYGESSDCRPALGFDSNGIGRLSWTGRGNGALNDALMKSDLTLQYKRTFYDTANNGPALCLHNDQMFATWACSGQTPDLNVAEMSRGGISVYGALSAAGIAVA